ncbi:hypothetical protein [Nannocystis punicea]|uniref:Uncharacterized protein n=1 Tax=Nannocystis punicea TaxID=2995304 RepID=A0ABY7HAD2_9BACT|nr:hypothetical protein [Nannocystis poenicansa]WAS96055.1 hypothetical protein O0S08_07810 [Nannocystis poenicansa]
MIIGLFGHALCSPRSRAPTSSRRGQTSAAAEARAIAAEITACDELGCADPPYAFAAEVLAVAPDLRVGLVHARLRDGPATDGLDLMLRRYRARCEEAQ